jgi:uncharacterized protein YneF (UPF0154 family)
MIMLAVALLMSMVLCLLFGVPYIDFLRKKTIGQYILDVAPVFRHSQRAVYLHLPTDTMQLQ